MDFPAVGTSALTVDLPSLFNFDRRLPESGGYNNGNSLVTCATGTSQTTAAITEMRTMPMESIDVSGDDRTDLSLLSGSIASSNGPAPANGASGQRATVQQSNVR